MARNFGGKGGAKLPQRGRESKHEQFGRQPKGAVLCPECGNIKFKKRWHPSEKSEGLEEFRDMKDILMRDLCPACQMVKDHQFEGEIFIGAFPKKYDKELLNLVRAFGTRATAIDPQDRIIDLTKIKGGYHITTTENELAVKIAKKIRDVFTHVDLSISYASEPQEVSRVHVTYLPDETKNKNAPKKVMKKKVPKKK